MCSSDLIDSFDDLAGMTLDLSDKNIVPDDKGKVEIDVSDAVQQCVIFCEQNDSISKNLK